MNVRRALTLSLFFAMAFIAAKSGASNDFDKATLVGEVRLEKGAGLRRELTLPSGRARLMLAIRDFKCAPIEATVQVKVSGPDGLLFSEQFSLSKLTWSYGQDSCDAIGYLELADSSGDGVTNNGGQMRLRIG